MEAHVSRASICLLVNVYLIFPVHFVKPSLIDVLRVLYRQIVPIPNAAPTLHASVISLQTAHFVVVKMVIKVNFV